MKKVSTVIILALALSLLVGCQTGKVNYEGNLGYDLNRVKYKDITFNIYHSNTESHNWELLASFPCEPKPGYYNDVELQYVNNTISAVLRSNTMTESSDKNEITYSGTTEAEYDFTIDGFDGFFPAQKYFDVENKAGEQFVRLYPISNDGGSFYNNINLNEAYDTDNVNIDNILITIVMK